MVVERFCFGKVRCGVERDEIEEAIEVCEREREREKNVKENWGNVIAELCVIGET